MPPDYLLDELDEEPVPNRNRASRHIPNDCQNVITGRPKTFGTMPFHNHMVGSASNSATNAPRKMNNKPAPKTEANLISIPFLPRCASGRHNGLRYWRGDLPERLPLIEPF